MTRQHPHASRWRKPPHAPPPRPDSPTPPAEIIGEEVRQALQPHPGRRMTENEFLQWVGEKTRAEWVEGEVTIMSPVSSKHDIIRNWLHALLLLFVQEHDLGQVCGSELAVCLPKPKGRRLPDIFFVPTASLSAIHETSFNGPPDLIVEIVSPDSTTRDYREKFVSYEASGVKEYWIVDPLAKQVEALELVRGKYRTIPLKKSALHSKVLKGFFLKPAWLWDPHSPKVADALRQIAAP